MIFDKVMKCGDEHNSGFFTAEQYMLTEVGQWQAQLMQNIGYDWLENKKAVPSAQKSDYAKCRTRQTIIEAGAKSVCTRASDATRQSECLVKSYYFKCGI